VGNKEQDVKHINKINQSEYEAKGITKRVTGIASSLVYGFRGIKERSKHDINNKHHIAL
jgi:ABC-type ATPase with predicted acetyltransferase domain